MDLRSKKIAVNIILAILILGAVVCLVVSVRMYLYKVDKKAKSILEITDTSYISKRGKENSSGLYVQNVKKDILDFVGDRDISSVSYCFEGEKFHIDFAIEIDKDDSEMLTIKKIVNEDLGINARMDMKNVESIEYRTGNSNNATLLKINSAYSHDYFAMSTGAYYFLGNDIESIGFMNGQFYYMSYNPNYTYLEEAKSCSNEVIKEIDGFNKNDYYYKYGMINFLPEYYQKLASKTYKVEDKCNEFVETEKK